MDKRLLIVDNDPGCLDVMTEIFENNGFEVKGLKRASNIFNEIEQFKPDALILDYILEGINGGEICHQVKTTDGIGNIPVIIVSAYSRVLNSLGNYGSDAIVTKPFDIFELIKVVSNLNTIY